MMHSDDIDVISYAFPVLWMMSFLSHNGQARATCAQNDSIWARA